jgi:hypothetical protein
MAAGEEGVDGLLREKTRPPGRPLKPGKCGTMTHFYKRHGTTTLFAALNVLDGTIIGRNMHRHRHQEFIRCLNAVDAGSRRQDRPCHRRQLCTPQASQGSSLACPPSLWTKPADAILAKTSRTPAPSD